MIQALVMPTPLAPFALLAWNDHLIGAGFTEDPQQVRGHLHPRLRELPQAEVSDLGPLSDAVDAYFAGHVDALDRLPVHHPTTPARERLWVTMRTVPAGTTMTYGELAEKAGISRGARVAGTACATNPIPLIIPCHRIVAAAGKLGGFYYGLEVKSWLLDHENKHCLSAARAAG